MSMKQTLALLLILISFGAHAIPPIPPSSMFNKIKTIAARNCRTENDIQVSELKDTETVKFILELNKDSNSGTLTMLENGIAVEKFKVNCK